MARSAFGLALIAGLASIAASQLRHADGASPANQATTHSGAVEPRANTDLEARLDAIVARLASASWDEREAASAELLELPMPEAQPFIVRRLGRRGLDPEQRHRLVEAACRRLLEQPRGAIGISMEPVGAPPGGVRIAAIVPGMPAADVLRIGDIIETINDEPILSSTTLSDLIQKLAPGTPVRLRVQRPVLDGNGRPRRDRDGQTVLQPMEVTMKLGSMEQLEAADRFGRGGIRRSSDVQQRREAEARWLRREFAAEAEFVAFAGRSGEQPPASFVALLADLERAIDRLEQGGDAAGTGGAGHEATLLQVDQALDRLRARQSDPDVSSDDKERFIQVMRRLTRVMARHADLAPIDRLDAAPAR